MKFFKQTIATVPLQGETVLLRTDFNVPLTDTGGVSDDFRIRASLPTIRKLLDDGCKIVIISHLGRPNGVEQKYSLEVAAQRLANYLEMPVRFVEQATGDRVRMAVKRAPKRSIIVLENLRFYPAEEANSMEFAAALAKDTGARYFIQDGFGVVHRAHASTSAITQYLPSVAGLLLQQEYTAITQAMQAPKRPLVAIMGGAKVRDKVQTMKALIDVADSVIVGGAMANTFLAYRGHDMGKSVVETGITDILDEIYEMVRAKVGEDKVDEFLLLPTDVAVAKSFENTEVRRTVTLSDIAADDIALDIGDDSINAASKRIEQAGTVIWNGPVGYASMPEFSHGSARVALTLATHPNVTSIIGGGDTADFVLGWDARNGASFTHISTGGGASMELMAGLQLPGIESLLDAR